MNRSATAVLMLFALVLSSCETHQAIDAPVANGVAVVSLQPGVSPSQGRQVLIWLGRVRKRLERDIGARRGIVHVTIFATHHAFARALWRQQHLRAQGPADNTGGIVGGRLLLGPEDPAYLHHNLTHIYTEWLLDRVIDNPSDRLPAHTWLYDGIAEYEAIRYTPMRAGCTGRNSTVLDITRIQSPARWLVLRSGPLSALEYCLAALRVQNIVQEVGWNCLITSLRRRGLAGTAVILEQRGAHRTTCRAL